MTLHPPRPRLWEVNVPTRHSTKPCEGLHVFTGRAVDKHAALAAARAAVDQALQAQAVGAEPPPSTVEGWAARALRPGWVLDWDAATASEWRSPLF